MIKVGLIGCGGIARWAHSLFYKAAEDVKVVAICDIDSQRLEIFHKEGIPDADTYSDYHDVLNREDIDCIDICTPNYLHAQIAVEAFAKGKHVFSEKPDAVSPELVLAMKEASEKADKVLMVMRNNRFTDASRYAKQYIEDGRMGRVYAARCGWQRRRGIPGKGGWFTTKAQSGGGPLIDLGVHMIDLAIWLMGNPTPVAVSGATYCEFANSDVSDSVNSAFGKEVKGGTFDVEDLAMGFIRFDNGAVLQIEFSWASNVKEEHRFVELRGTKAGLLWQDGTKLEFYSEEHGQLTDLNLSGNLADNGHVRNLRNFYDVVQGKAEPCFKPQQGVDMIKILTAIYKSAETGREVVL